MKERKTKLDKKTQGCTTCTLINDDVTNFLSYAMSIFSLMYLIIQSIQQENALVTNNLIRKIQTPMCQILITVGLKSNQKALNLDGYN